MRIAISGSHRTGKSTLLADLSRHLPAYATVEEPYHLLEEDGCGLSHPPALEDFEAQLERSIAELSEERDDVLFDRCPLDFLGYISLHEEADSFAFGRWIPRVRAALQTLDLIVWVPIEPRDRIAFSPSDEEGATRAEVDEKLKEMVYDDPFEVGVEILEVAGDPESRVRAVLRRIRRG